MLARVDGERIGNQGLYPSDNPAWQRRMAKQESGAGSKSNPPYRKKKTQSTNTATETPIVIRIGPEHGTTPRDLPKPGTTGKNHQKTGRAPRVKPLVVEVEPEETEQPAGFWASLRSLFGKR